MSDDEQIAAAHERLDAMSWIQLAALHDVQRRDAEAHARLERLAARWSCGRFSSPRAPSTMPDAGR